MRRLVIDFPDLNSRLMEKDEKLGLRPRLSKVSGVFAFEMMMDENENKNEGPFQVQIMSSGCDSDWIQCNFVAPYSIFIDSTLNT